MEKARISAIAAVGKNKELGAENKLLWKLDADFERMKRLIKGHPLIMGRSTYESVGCEMPHCPNIVVTRDENYVSPYKKSENTIVVHSLDEAIAKAEELEKRSEHEEKEVFIFGGASIYNEALSEGKVERLYITEIDAEDPKADSFFPEYKQRFPKKLEEIEHNENDITFRLLTLERE